SFICLQLRTPFLMKYSSCEQFECNDSTYGPTNVTLCVCDQEGGNKDLPVNILYS
ncbi:MAG: hypothetical protein ACI8RD_013023, partial [Bacillariaceae sp.]